MDQRDADVVTQSGYGEGLLIMLRKIVNHAEDNLMCFEVIEWMGLMGYAGSPGLNLIFLAGY